MKTGLFLVSIFSLGDIAVAWTPSPSSSSPSSASSRRTFLDNAAKIVPLVFAAEAAYAEDEAQAPSVTEAQAPSVTEAVAVQAAEGDAPATTVVAEDEPPPQATPSGDGDENDFIATLRARSEANKDKYKAMSESNDKLSKRQFLSQYDRPSFVGVHSPSNDKVTMVLKEELEPMLANGRVKRTYESKISKKTGEISDDYSRPIFVYAN